MMLFPADDLSAHRHLVFDSVSGKQPSCKLVSVVRAGVTAGKGSKRSPGTQANIGVVKQ